MNLILLCNSEYLNQNGGPNVTETKSFLAVDSTPHLVDTIDFIHTPFWKDKNFLAQRYPGGAAKLTAQSIGVMLQIQNEMLRTQATGLKLQAETLALQNRKDKDRTRQMVAGANDLNSALTNQKPQFVLPRFE